MITATYLKSAREQLGLNKKEMAQRLELTPEWYGMLEGGKKTVSKDIALRLRFLLRSVIESGSSLDPSSLDGMVEEPAAPYAGAAEIKIELRKSFASILEAAGDDRDRLGWVAEQLRLHLPIPPHWRTFASGALHPDTVITPEMHDQALREVLEEERKAASSSRPPHSSKGKAQGGAGR